MRFEQAVREQWPAEAETVLGLIRGTIDPDTFASVQTWVRACYHPPSKHDRIACALNEALSLHGVEAIPADDCNVFDPPAVEYLNAGDPYVSTLLYIRGRWRVGCWGDVVERMEAGQE